MDFSLTMKTSCLNPMEKACRADAEALLELGEDSYPVIFCDWQGATGTLLGAWTDRVMPSHDAILWIPEKKRGVYRVAVVIHRRRQNILTVSAKDTAPEIIDRRSNKRLPLIGVLVEFAEESKRAEMMPALGIDINLTGILLQTAEMIASGATLHVSLLGIDLTGEVVRSSNHRVFVQFAKESRRALREKWQELEQSLARKHSLDRTGKDASQNLEITATKRRGLIE